MKSLKNKLSNVPSSMEEAMGSIKDGVSHAYDSGKFRMGNALKAALISLPLLSLSQNTNAEEPNPSQKQGQEYRVGGGENDGSNDMDLKKWKQDVEERVINSYADAYISATGNNENKEHIKNMMKIPLDAYAGNAGNPEDVSIENVAYKVAEQYNKINSKPDWNSKYIRPEIKNWAENLVNDFHTMYSQGRVLPYKDEKDDWKYCKREVQNAITEWVEANYWGFGVDKAQEKIEEEREKTKHAWGEIPTYKEKKNKMDAGAYNTSFQ